MGIASVVTVGLLTVAVASPTSARGHRGDSTDRGTRHAPKTSASAVTLTPEQQVAIDAFNAAVVEAKEVRKSATDAARTTYLAAKAAAAATKAAALAVATTDAERTAAKAAYRAEVRVAHDVRKATDSVARAAFNAAVTAAGSTYTAATGLTAPRIKSHK